MAFFWSARFAPAAILALKARPTPPCLRELDPRLPSVDQPDDFDRLELVRPVQSQPPGDASDDHWRAVLLKDDNAAHHLTREQCGHLGPAAQGYAPGTDLDDACRFSERGQLQAFRTRGLLRRIRRRASAVTPIRTDA